jgi:di/tricarboxylate transporter
VTPQIAYILALLVAALVLFWTEVVAVDIVAIGILLGVTVPSAVGFPILTATEALGAFGEGTVVLLICDLMLSRALVVTGVTAALGKMIYSVGAKRPAMLLPLLFGIAAFVSAWLPNTLTMALFLPIALNLTNKVKLSPSRVLMPLAFAIILGGGCTLIGSSTNLVIASRLNQFHLAPMTLFEITPVGVPMAIAGIAFLLATGAWLMPERHKSGELTVDYKMRNYLAELVVLPKSRFVGRTVRETRLGDSLDLTVLGVIRDGTEILSPAHDFTIREGDLLLVNGSVANILRIRDVAGIEIKPDVTLHDPDLSSTSVGLAEVLVMPGCWLAGRTLKETLFRERQDLTVLAVNHHGGIRRRRLSDMILRAGDVLLLQGPREAISRMDLDRNNFLLLEDVGHEIVRTKRAPYAIAIFVSVVLVGSLRIVPFSVAFLLGVVLMFLTGCLTPKEGYRSVNWEIMVRIGCMIAFGDAMEKTHTAQYIASFIVAYVSPYGVYAILSAFFFLTILLTQPMSHQAAALVIMPIAVGTASSVGINPRTVIMMILFAASCGHVAPIEPACIMAWGPGRYRFRDFVTAGAALTLVVYIVTILLVPLIWKP